MKILIQTVSCQIYPLTNKIQILSPLNDLSAFTSVYVSAPAETTNDMTNPIKIISI